MLGVVGTALVLLVLHAYRLFSFGFTIVGCVALVGYLDCGLQGRCLWVIFMARFSGLSLLLFVVWVWVDGVLCWFGLECWFVVLFGGLFSRF